MTITELIAALEAADKPSRELDASIGSLIGTYVGFEPPPRYTSSIDAALTLLPDGAMWRLGRHLVPDDQPEHAYSARVGGPRYYDHSSPAIALCIAALRAREEATWNWCNSCAQK